MTEKIIPAISQEKNNYFLFDASAVENVSIDLFNPDWLQQHGQTEDISSGRGAAWFVSYQNNEWVLRHYRRGGQVAKLIKDQYFGLSINGSRCWREWKLLQKLYSHQLPVPRPVAAHVQRQLFFYRADIIVEKIPGTTTLASRLTQQALNHEHWRNIGATIRQFHDFNVYHADLNAHNILLNQHNEIFIIDFDRGEIRANGSWKTANLQRLQRSLLKLQTLNKNFIFNDEDWQSLSDGYYQK